MTPKDLAEAEGKPIALAWIDAAIVALNGYLEWLAGGEEPSTRAVVDRALEINFSLAPSARLFRIPFVLLVLGTFTRARDVIARSDRLFSNVSEEETRRIFGADGGMPPAYAIFGQGVFFTPWFAPHDPATGTGFGPLCRAAMIVHESVHVIDRVSGEPAIHISEWAEPAFSAQTLEESVHNPSAYASFSAQVHEGALEWPRDVRYGAGRPAD